MMIIKGIFYIITILKFLRVLWNIDLSFLSRMEWHARNLKTWRNLLSSLCVMILKCIIFTEQTLKCFNYRKILNLSCYSHFQYS